MLKLNYFKIGFMADNSATALRNFRDSNNYDEFFIKDAYKLSTLCRKAWKGDSEDGDNSESIIACRKALISDISELSTRPGSEGSEIFLERESMVYKTESAMEELFNNKKISRKQLELGIIFFENLYEKCSKLSSPVPSCW